MYLNRSGGPGVLLLARSELTDNPERYAKGGGRYRVLGKRKRTKKAIGSVGFIERCFAPRLLVRRQEDVTIYLISNTRRNLVMKRKTFFVLVLCLSVIAFLASMSLAAPKKDIGPPSHAKIPDFAPPSGAGAFEVLNPVADFEVQRIVPVERPTNLDHKMIVLYWNAKLNSNNIVDEIRLKLKEIYPTSDFAIVQGSAWQPMPGFYDEILALEPDVVISSTAD